jgi:hypothetical protein
MLALLQLLAAEDAATEGKKVITGMLIVGLIFVGVIVLGETTHWLRHRRREIGSSRRPPRSNPVARKVGRLCSRRL